MLRRYVTVDVFTDQIFGGNPLAVVLDAEGLTTAQMQSVATEFNYSETTFVLRPRDNKNSANVRIFTPATEVPFAGHPNVGTAVVLAQAREAAGDAPVEHFVFEEAAGLVQIRILRDAAKVVGAELTAPERLSIGSSVSLQDAAACLSLGPNEICELNHPPQVLSVGLPFLVAELISTKALGRCKPVASVHERVLLPIGTNSVFAYARGSSAGYLHARMFSPLDAVNEDPATGSATGATIALLASLEGKGDEEMSWRVEQGATMGRPSVILGRTEMHGGVITAVHIAGHVVQVMNGSLRLPSLSVETNGAS